MIKDITFDNNVSLLQQVISLIIQLTLLQQVISLIIQLTLLQQVMSLIIQLTVITTGNIFDHTVDVNYNR